MIALLLQALTLQLNAPLLIRWLYVLPLLRLQALPLRLNAPILLRRLHALALLRLLCVLALL